MRRFVNQFSYGTTRLGLDSASSFNRFTNGRRLNICANTTVCQNYSSSGGAQNKIGKESGSPEPGVKEGPSSSPPVSVGSDHTGYCLNLLKKHEYESFLCTLLLNGFDIRNFVCAVRAFNVEIALIRDQVSQKDVGLGRLTFWRNAVNKVFQSSGNSKQEGLSDIPRHPVVLELNRVLKNKKVSKKWFVNLMDAREQILNDVAFKDLQELEAYCDKSVSPMLYLGFEALGIKNVEVDHACSHLGKAIGLANFIRSIPYNAQKRRVLVPQELLVKHKLSQENFIRVTNKEKIADAVFDVASNAHAHYKKARALRADIPEEGLPLTLIGTPTDIYLERLEKFQFDPYDPRLNRRNSLLPVHLYFRKLSRKFY